jgi:putative serine protease PepD
VSGTGETPGKRRATKGIAAILVVLGLLGGGFAVGRALEDDTSSASPSTTAANVQNTSVTTQRATTTTSGSSSGSSPSGTQATQPPKLDEDLEPTAAAAKALMPAVVQLSTQAGLGSGFIFDSAGNIMTAAHVIDGATSVEVQLADGRTMQGTVVGSDQNTDVAVVKIQPFDGMPVASLALNDPPVVGQTVLAIGSPFGLDQTVTEGIVSSVGRPVEVNNGVVAMLQTDASINHGNSGGALADLKGRVLGINDQIASSSGDNAGVGFAIPIDIANDVAQRIIKGQSLDVGYLGVSTGENPSSNEPGALITQVVAGSPAEKAGLKDGDVVYQVGDQAIRNYIELQAQIRQHRPGDKVELKVHRAGDDITITATLGTQGR